MHPFSWSSHCSEGRQNINKIISKMQSRLKSERCWGEAVNREGVSQCHGVCYLQKMDTRLTEKVTSEKRPEAGEGVDQDGILASLKTEKAESTKSPSLKQVTFFCGKHRKKDRARGEQKQERLRE